MNRLVFNLDEGHKVRVNLETVTRICEREARAKFCVADKPAYLHIFFLRPLDEEELRGLYKTLVLYNLVEVNRMADFEIMIEEDLGKINSDPATASFEIKCPHFEDAYDCCYDDLARSRLFHDEAIAFQLSDEPSEEMADWLKKHPQREEHTV